MKVSPTLAAIVDQAANSGITFVCAIALMFYGTESAFAAFGLLTTYLALVSSVQTSLIGSPLQVLAGRLSGGDRAVLLTKLSFFQCQGVLLSMFGLGIALVVASQLLALNWTDLALMLACVGAFWLRDFQRTENVVLLQSARLMFTALWSLAAALLLLTAAVGLVGRISFALAVIALGLPQVMAVLPMCLRALRGRHSVQRGSLRALAVQFWPLSGWAVLGGILVWVQNQAHLTLAAGMAGVSVVVVLAASRLIISPAASAVTGLNRLNLSRFGTEFRRAGAPALETVRRRAIKAALLLHLGYLGLLVMAKVLGLDRHLPPAYQGIWDLIFLWFLFSALVSVRGCVTASVQVIEGFQWMFKLSAWGCAISLILSIGGYQVFPLAHCFILAPLLTELFFLLMAARRFRALTSAS